MSASQKNTKNSTMSTMVPSPFKGVLKSRFIFTLARAMRGILPLFSLKNILLTKSKCCSPRSQPPAVMRWNMSRLRPPAPLKDAIPPWGIGFLARRQLAQGLSALVCESHVMGRIPTRMAKAILDSIAPVQTDF